MRATKSTRLEMSEIFQQMIALSVFFTISKRSLGLYQGEAVSHDINEVKNFILHNVNCTLKKHEQLVSITVCYMKFSLFIQNHISKYFDKHLALSYRLTKHEQLYMSHISELLNTSSKFDELCRQVSDNIELARSVFDYCETSAFRMIIDLYKCLLRNNHNGAVNSLAAVIKSSTFLAIDERLFSPNVKSIEQYFSQMAQIISDS